MKVEGYIGYFKSPPAKSHPSVSDPYWYACEFPERPADDQTVWWVPCRGCHLALIAAVATGQRPQLFLTEAEAILERIGNPEYEGVTASIRTLEEDPHAID